MKHKLNKSERQICISEVEPIVERFKNEFNISMPISDSFKTIEDDLGYFIITKKVNDKLSGFQYRIGEKNFIFVNNNHDLGRQIFSLWHEVYHLYTGDGEPISTEGSAKFVKSEFKANAFASRILVDRKKLREVIANNTRLKFKKEFSQRDVVLLQQYFKVSFQSMCYSLKEEFPDSIHGSFFSFGSVNRRKELNDLTDSLGFERNLNEVPSEDYISPMFFDVLNNNLQDNKASINRIEEILNYVTKELNIDNE